jgi:hypothetical protein
VTGAGKTHYVYSNHDAKDIYRVMPPKTHNTAPWMDGYIGQSVIFFDEFYCDIPLGWMLQALDKYPMQVEVKGGSTWLVPEIIYIASNLDPQEWYEHRPSAQRDALRRRFTSVTEYTQAFH